MAKIAKRYNSVLSPNRRTVLAIALALMAGAVALGAAGLCWLLDVVIEAAQK